jgi:hypothetical protein
VDRSQKELLLDSVRLVIVDRLQRVKSVTEYLSPMQDFLDQLIDRVRNNHHPIVDDDDDSDTTNHDDSSITDFTTWLALLDYLEFGTIISPRTLNRGSPTAELYQWPVWCDDIHYFLHDNVGQGIYRKAIVTTPCWHAALLDCTCLTAATSSMLGPFPAPTGRAYMLQELEFSLDDNTELHNIMSNDDRGVMIVPVRVALANSKGTSCNSWVVPPRDIIIGEKHNLPFLFLQQDNVIEWTNELLDACCHKIVALNRKLLANGFPLLREGASKEVNSPRASSNQSSFLNFFLDGSHANDLGSTLQCSHQ